MKKTFVQVLVLGLMGAGAIMPASAFILDKADDKKPSEAAPSALSKFIDKSDDNAPEATQAPAAVQKAVTKLNSINGTASETAEIYIYLQSASWCGPCRAEMPEIAKEYLKMRETGKVELILISCDRDQAAAKKFAEQNNASFPVVMANDPSVAQLPGFKKAQGIPYAIVVTKDGKEIVTGHGSLVKGWRLLLK